VAFTGFFLTIGAWAVAAPYDATADEHDHIYRAVGVVSGDVMPEPTDAIRGSGAFVWVPSGLIRPFPPESAGGKPTGAIERPCWTFSVATSASCAEPPSADDTPVLVGSGAGRYNPLYYAAVGLPLKLWPGWSGVLLARLLSAAFAAALLAAAIAVVLRHARHGLVLAAIVVGATPMSLHFMGAINPNGLEIAAGIAFFSAAIPLFLKPVQERTQGLLWLTGISAICLAMLRPTGLAYLALGVAALAFPLRSANTGELLRSRLARRWIVAIALACGLAAVWIVVMQSTDAGNIFTFGRRFGVGQALYTVGLLPYQLMEQAIGAFNWLETRIPAPAYLVWEGMASTLLVAAFAIGRRIDRYRLIALFIGGVGFPLAMQLYYINSVGLITQGRYLLPMLVGLVLMAGYILSERGLPENMSRSLTRLAIAFLLPLQLAGLAYNMVRWQRGIPNGIGLGWLNPFVGAWKPVLSPWTPLLAAAIGLVVLAWLGWIAAAQRTLVAPAGTAPATADSPATDARGRHRRNARDEPRLAPSPGLGAIDNHVVEASHGLQS
jgi:hypothetical protein